MYAAEDIQKHETQSSVIDWFCFLIQIYILFYRFSTLKKWQHLSVSFIYIHIYIIYIYIYIYIDR